MTFLHIIRQSEYLHDICNKPLWVYTHNGSVGSMVDYNKFDWESLKDERVYTTDLMYLYYCGVNLKDVEDLRFICYYLTNKSFERDVPLVENFYKRLYPTCNAVNLLVPKSFWFDSCTKMYEECKPLFIQDVNQFYKKQLKLFKTIESNGLMYKDEIHHSRYNFFTTTSRPSNSFGGINYAAFSKKDGSRSQIKSKYKDGILVEVDFESYHPRLIADLIHYELPKDETVYKHFAKYYYDTDTPTLNQIKTAKEKTFKKIYGALNSKKETVPYFKAAADYVDGVWKNFRQNKQIITPISKRALYYENYKDINALTIFNYLIQLTETERNVEALVNNSLASDIVLYTYDAILLDIPKKKLASTIAAVKKTIASEQYPVKIKVGYTYDDLQVWDVK